MDLSSAHLVATSFGGYVALRSAAAHPDRIGRLVLFSWSAGLPVDRLPTFMRMMSVPGLGRLAAAMPANERSVGVIFRGLGHGPSLADGRITAADIDAYLALLRYTDTQRNELAMGRALLSPIRGMRDFLLPDALARVDRRADAPDLGRARPLRRGGYGPVARRPPAERHAGAAPRRGTCSVAGRAPALRRDDRRVSLGLIRSAGRPT